MLPLGGAGGNSLITRPFCRRRCVFYGEGCPSVADSADSFREYMRIYVAEETFNCGEVVRDDIVIR